MRIEAASDQAVLVTLGEEIGEAAHGRVLALLRLLQREPVEWIRNVQPAYCSLLITFDAMVVDHAEVQAKLTEMEKRAEGIPAERARLVEIPVCYGGEFGPDLEEVASALGLRAEDVVRMHTARTYHAYFLGFAPGFAYLGDLAEELAMPRLATPRKQVPAGSVGIAGRQTGVYPFATPGGWRLIGRTPWEIFRKERVLMGMIAIGDRVRFREISGEEFAAASRA